MKNKWKSEMDPDGKGMIKEDKSAMANMPQSVIMKPYPKCRNATLRTLNDSITGIDSNTKDTAEKVQGNQSDSMN